MSTRQYLLIVAIFISGVIVGSTTNQRRITNSVRSDIEDTPDAVVTFPDPDHPEKRISAVLEVVSISSKCCQPNYSVIKDNDWMIILSKNSSGGNQNPLTYYMRPISVTK